MTVKPSHLELDLLYYIESIITSFFLYTRPSLRHPTAPVTCKVAFGTGLSAGYFNTRRKQKEKRKVNKVREGKI